MEIRLRACGCGTFHLSFDSTMTVDLSPQALSDLREVLIQATQDLGLCRPPRPRVHPQAEGKVIRGVFTHASGDGPDGKKGST